jgi:hypothetical protein
MCEELDYITKALCNMACALLRSLRDLGTLNYPNRQQFRHNGLSVDHSGP